MISILQSSIKTDSVRDGQVRTDQFQFYKVRLKQNVGRRVVRRGRRFQFYKVRLKPMSGIPRLPLWNISILQSSIKTPSPR